MKRRRWPDVIIVIAVLAIGASGVWALWREDLADKPDRRAPEVPAAAPPTT